MKILLNLLLGTSEHPDTALSVAEDEDGTICVALIGSLPTSYLTDEGGVCFAQSGFWELLNSSDAEEVADCARTLASPPRAHGEDLDEQSKYELRRIADVIFVAWAEQEATTPG